MPISKKSLLNMALSHTLPYTHPFSKKITLESGAQYLINTVSNTYEVLDFVSNSWITNNNFNNTFHYDQRVLGVYSTLAYELEKWGIKGGLRLENTNLNTELINNNENNTTKYSNLFPSLHSSYKINEKTSIQAGWPIYFIWHKLWLWKGRSYGVFRAETILTDKAITIHSSSFHLILSL